MRRILVVSVVGLLLVPAAASAAESTSVFRVGTTTITRKLTINLRHHRASYFAYALQAGKRLSLCLQARLQTRQNGRWRTRSGVGICDGDGMVFGLNRELRRLAVQHRLRVVGEYDNFGLRFSDILRY